MKVKLILVEGPSNVGKTTLITNFKKHLEANHSDKAIPLYLSMSDAEKTEEHLKEHFDENELNTILSTIKDIGALISSLYGFNKPYDRVTLTDILKLVIIQQRLIDTVLNYCVNNFKDKGKEVYLLVDRTPFSTLVYKELIFGDVIDEFIPESISLLTDILSNSSTAFFKTRYGISFYDLEKTVKLEILPVLVINSEPFTSVPRNETDAAYDNESKEKHNKYVSAYVELFNELLKVGINTKTINTSYKDEKGALDSLLESFYL